MILLMFQLLKGLRSRDRRILNTNWGLAAFSQVGAAKGRDRTFIATRALIAQKQKTLLRTGRSYDSFATATSAGRSSRPFSTYPFCITLTTVPGVLPEASTMLTAW